MTYLEAAEAVLKSARRPLSASQIVAAALKKGLLAPTGRSWVGQLHLADISVPEQVYRHLGLTLGRIFANGYISSIDLP